MNFSLFLLTATTKWSQRLYYIQCMWWSCSSCFLWKQASIPMLLGRRHRRRDGRTVTHLECVRLNPLLPPCPHQQTATKRRACCLLVLYVCTSIPPELATIPPQYEKHTGTNNVEFPNRIFEIKTIFIGGGQKQVLMLYFSCMVAIS